MKSYINDAQREKPWRTIKTRRKTCTSSRQLDTKKDIKVVVMLRYKRIRDHYKAPTDIPEILFIMKSPLLRNLLK